MGPQGLKGDKGDTGCDGVPGFAGDNGDVGPQGPKEDVKPMGPAGQQGSDGSKGDQVGQPSLMIPQASYQAPDNKCSGVFQCTFTECMGLSWAGFVYAIQNFIVSSLSTAFGQGRRCSEHSVSVDLL